MSRAVPRPPDSPSGNIEEWRQQRKNYVDASWDIVEGGKTPSLEDVGAEIKGKSLRNNEDTNGYQETNSQQIINPPEHEVEDSSDLINVQGDLPPLVDEGLRVMVCIDYELRQTRFALKDYLKWIDEDTGHLFHQFFPHYDKYPIGSKAVRNYIVAMGERPKRLDRMNLRKLVGRRAEVFVETVKPEYGLGVLKGQPMPESMHYSKVAEIIHSLGRVELDTLNQLRKRC